MGQRGSELQGDFQFIDPGELVDGALKLVLVERKPGNAEMKRVPEYRFHMRLDSSGDPIGAIVLRVGDLPEYIGHIGYDVEPDHRGHHFAARSLKLIRDLARHHGMDEIVITCLPENTASVRTCELAGARFAGMVAIPDEVDDDYHKSISEKCRYVLST